MASRVQVVANTPHSTRSFIKIWNCSHQSYGYSMLWRWGGGRVELIWGEVFLAQGRRKFRPGRKARSAALMNAGSYSSSLS